MGRYDDIIDQPAPPIRTRVRMKREARASQFAPFAAMVGHDRMIAEAMRYVGKKSELSEEEKLSINNTLIELSEGVLQGEIEIVYFKPDARKDGGEYTTVRGEFSKIKLHEGVLVLKSGTEIKIEELKKITPIKEEI